MSVGQNTPGQNVDKGCECIPFNITVDATAAAVLGYNTASLMAAIVATGLTFPSTTAVAATDMLHQIDFGLKPVNGHYSPDGIAGNEVVSTTSDAKLEFPAGGGEWRDLDPMGEEEFKVGMCSALPDFVLNVTEGSIVIISGSVSRPL